MSKENKCDDSNCECKYKVLDAVPYQCCPLCGGEGRIIADGFTSAFDQECKVCFGARIIPMCVIPKSKQGNIEYKAPST